jgi:hypothetical protein
LLCALALTETFCLGNRSLHISRRQLSRLQRIRIVLNQSVAIAKKHFVAGGAGLALPKRRVQSQPTESFVNVK